MDVLKKILITLFITIIFSFNYKLSAENSYRDFLPPRTGKTPVKNGNKVKWHPPQQNHNHKQKRTVNKNNNREIKTTNNKKYNHAFYMERLTSEIRFIREYHDKIFFALKRFAIIVSDADNLKETRKTLADRLSYSKLFSAVFLAYSPGMAIKKRSHYMIWFVKKRNRIIRLFPEYKRYNYLKMRWFLRPQRTGKIYFTKPYRVRGKIMISAVIPVIRNGQRIAAIGADIHFSRITGKIAGMRFGRKGFAFLVAGNGIILAHPNRRYIGRKNVFKFKKSATLFNLGTPDAQVYALARLMLRKRGKGKTIIKDSHSGDKYTAYFGPIPGTRWAFCIMIKISGY